MEIRTKEEVDNHHRRDMETTNIFSATTAKTIQEFIRSLRENAPKFDFRVHEVVDMRKLYDGYGIEVADNFEVYTITLCSPQKSYKSITKNPARNAAIIESKHIVVYRGDQGVTTINYLPLPQEFIRETFPDDAEFPENIHQSCQQRIKIIEASL